MKYKSFDYFERTQIYNKYTVVAAAAAAVKKMSHGSFI
jgi:hypothetical protein